MSKRTQRIERQLCQGFCIFSDNRGEHKGCWITCISPSFSSTSSLLFINYTYKSCDENLRPRAGVLHIKAVVTTELLLLDPQSKGFYIISSFYIYDPSSNFTGSHHHPSSFIRHPPSFHAYILTLTNPHEDNPQVTSILLVKTCLKQGIILSFSIMDDHLNLTL